MIVTLAASQWQTITEHLQSALPNEACGLLAGRDGRTEAVYLIANAERSPTRYSMEPGELIRAIVEIEDNGWELIGIFHSHPAGPPIPSPTDIAEAYYPDSAYVICYPADKGWQARAFEIRDGKVGEVGVQIGAETRGFGAG
ncbi:MAG TPA: M67 family metallopeptidase [Anaerolineales bacterium]|nr:M67 family metallopeptidase [Anaerolineales bacterium]